MRGLYILAGLSLSLCIQWESNTKSLHHDASPEEQLENLSQEKLADAAAPGALLEERAKGGRAEDFQKVLRRKCTEAAGRYNEKGTYGFNKDCWDCPNGKYKSDRHLNKCLSCPAGYYTYSSKSDPTHILHSGGPWRGMWKEYSPLGDRFISCKSCTAGKSSSAGASSCN